MNRFIELITTPQGQLTPINMFELGFYEALMFLLIAGIVIIILNIINKK